MLGLTRRPWLAGVLGLTALAFTGPGVRGQTPLRSGLTQQQFNNVAALSRLSMSIGGFGFNPYAGLGNSAGAALYGSSLANLSANPYAAGSQAGSPYGSYYEDPNGAYLRGSAQVIDSQGRIMVNQQQAFLLREQVGSQRVATARKVFDENLYERQMTPTAEEERRRLLAQSVQRARNHPPVTEIWSGKSLNDLLADLQTQPVGKISADHDALPISLDGLRHINFAKGAGSIALLKNEGRLHWPVALTGSDYAGDRDGLTALAQDAVRQAEFNSRVDAGTIRQLTDGLNKLRQQLRKAVSDLAPAEYIEAKNFINAFDDAVTALRQKDAGTHLAGRDLLKATSMAELVKYMTEHGLRFAPALPGDTDAYLALHKAFASYGQPASMETAAR
jgi:hypothetical protein